MRTAPPGLSSLRALARAFAGWAMSCTASKIVTRSYRPAPSASAASANRNETRSVTPSRSAWAVARSMEPPAVPPAALRVGLRPPDGARVDVDAIALYPREGPSDRDRGPAGAARHVRD